MPLLSSLPQKFPGLCYQNMSHSFICPRLFRLAAGGKEKLHMTVVESIGKKKVEKSLFCSTAVSFIK